MTDQQLKTVWSIFRMLMGLAVLVLASYSVIINNDMELLNKLLPILFGLVNLLQGGGVAVQSVRSNGNS